MTFPPTNYRPFGRLDSQGRVIPRSFDSLAYRATTADAGTYVAYARPGASESALVWQIQLQVFTDDVLTSITWPQDPTGNASNDFIFAWSSASDYTYS